MNPPNNTPCPECRDRNYNGDNICICGSKKGYYKCAVCGGDVPRNNVVWDAATNSLPMHYDECFTAYCNAARANDPPEQKDFTALADPGVSFKATRIPLNYTLEVIFQNQDNAGEIIKAQILDFLSNVIMAWQGAIIKYDDCTGIVNIDNFRLGEIEAAARAARKLDSPTGGGSIN